MPATFTCSICNDIIVQGEAFHGSQNNNPITVCFDCYLASLEPFDFDGEAIRYNAAGRDMDLLDWVVFYDQDGSTLTKTTVGKLIPGKLTTIKHALASELGLSPDDISIIIESCE